MNCISLKIQAILEKGPAELIGTTISESNACVFTRPYIPSKDFFLTLDKGHFAFKMLGMKPPARPKEYSLQTAYHFGIVTPF